MADLDSDAVDVARLLAPPGHEAAAGDDDESAGPSDPVRVTITTSGVSVTIEAHGPRADVAREAEDIHRRTHARCVGAAPAGFGGVL